MGDFGSSAEVSADDLSLAQNRQYATALPAVQPGASSFSSNFEQLTHTEQPQSIHMYLVSLRQLSQRFSFTELTITPEADAMFCNVVKEKYAHFFMTRNLEIGDNRRSCIIN